MKARKVMAAILTIVSLLTTAAAAETIHMNQTLESTFLTLHLDADVKNIPEGTPLTIYETDYPPLDAQNWAKFFLEKNGRTGRNIFRRKNTIN